MERGDKKAVFASKRLEGEYERLATSRHLADRRLYLVLERTRRILQRRYLSGTEIPNKKIPGIYRRLCRIGNLWSLSLWPYTVVLYTVGEEQVLIVDML